MMRPFRCLICGETYLGRNAPDRCPFCGVAGSRMVDAAEYVNYNGMEMCNQSKKFVQQAIEIEASNVAFYKCASDCSDNPVIKALFKRIGKQEGEHLELLADHLGVEEPEIVVEECCDSDAENMMKGHDREDRAVKMYTRFAQEAPEPRLKEIFSAIAGIEQEHYNMFNIFG